MPPIQYNGRFQVKALPFQFFFFVAWLRNVCRYFSNIMFVLCVSNYVAFLISCDMKLHFSICVYAPNKSMTNMWSSISIKTILDTSHNKICSDFWEIDFFFLKFEVQSSVFLPNTMRWYLINGLNVAIVAHQPKNSSCSLKIERFRYIRVCVPISIQLMEISRFLHLFFMWEMSL